MSVIPVPNSASNQELNVTLPSIRRIHGMIRQSEKVLLKLLTDDQIPGKIKWIDFECLGFEPESGEQMIIWLQAIAFIQALGPSIQPVPTPRREVSIDPAKLIDKEDDPFNF
jgi:host factor-I protein